MPTDDEPDDVRGARFEQLARELVDPLRRYLARRTDPHTADDVLADSLLVCWRRLDEVPAEPLPWAYGVARNCLANAERGARRQQRLATRISVVDPPQQSVPGPEDGRRDGDPALSEALASLRAEDAELLRLWAWEQLTRAEIAAVLDISPNTAGVRLHRARQRLRDRLTRTDRATGGNTGRNTGRGPGHDRSTEGQER